MTPRTLLVSLGNPAPYLNTLHSAGHHALAALQPLLGQSQAAFASQRIASKSALASFGPDHVLFQSPAIMNVSGKWVARAYKDLLADISEAVTPSEDGAKPALNLLLVHDDLEEELGVVKMRKWSSSHRGHNGIKSVNASLKPAGFPGARWARIAVGIGRPAQRERETVSDYVLKEMTRHQHSVLKEKAGRGVLRCLLEWEEANGIAKS